jgi:hypothetical protein
MAKYLTKKFKVLTKADWKNAREAAGFDATLFGGPAVGSKVEAFQKAVAGINFNEIGSLSDIKKLKTAVKATRELEAALRAYAEKAENDAKKGKNMNGLEFAKECRAYADKANKRLVKLEPQLKKMQKLWDDLTDGPAKRKALKEISADLGVNLDL